MKNRNQHRGRRLAPGAILGALLLAATMHAQAFDMTMPTDLSNCRWETRWEIVMLGYGEWGLPIVEFRRVVVFVC